MIESKLSLVFWLFTSQYHKEHDGKNYWRNRSKEKGKKALSDFVRAIPEDGSFPRRTGVQRAGGGREGKKSTRFHRNHFNKGYHRMSGEFTISDKEKIKNALRNVDV